MLEGIELKKKKVRIEESTAGHENQQAGLGKHKLYLTNRNQSV